MLKFGLLSTLAAFVLAGVLVAGASAGPGVSGVRDGESVWSSIDSSLKALTTTVGGATVLPTTRTVRALVRHDRSIRTTASPTATTWSAPIRTTAPARPARRTVAGGHHAAHREHRRSDVRRHRRGSGDARLAAVRERTTTARRPLRPRPERSRTRRRSSRGRVACSRRATPATQLQLEDATMRAQFNKTGSSSYHLILHPNVLPAVTINVPQNQGTLLVSGRGVVGRRHQHRLVVVADRQPRDEGRSDAPADLPDQPGVPVHRATIRLNCCVIGYHGTKATGQRRRQRQQQRQRSGADVRLGLVRPARLLRAAERRHRLGAAGHPRALARDRGVGATIRS